MQTLNLNSNGSEVQLLQRALSFLHYPLTIDSNFGPTTEAVVKKFQSDNNLTADGIVGPNTWASLDYLAPQGMDISHFNSDINWAMLSPHIQFVYCKASQGAGFKDPTLKTNMAAIKQKGLIFGAYHFLTFTEPASVQMANFLSCGINFSAPGTLPPVLDIEWQVGRNAAESQQLNQNIHNNKMACVQLIKDCLTLLTEKTGRTPMIYTSKEFWFEYFNDITDFSAQPLWVPVYQTASPQMFAQWNNFTMWQYSGGSSIQGAAAKVDLDIFNGNLAELKKLALL